METHQIRLYCTHFNFCRDLRD